MMFFLNRILLLIVFSMCSCAENNINTSIVIINIDSANAAFDYDLTSVTLKKHPRYSILSKDQAQKICQKSNLKFDKSMQYVLLVNTKNVIVENRFFKCIEKNEGLFLLKINKDIKLMAHPPYDFIECKRHQLYTQANQSTHSK